jgi:hypothetical protein
VAAYLLDRADQYDTESACWVALADAAGNVLAGEHRRSYEENEFDASLVARVRRMHGRAVARVNPRAGLEPDEDDD